MTTNPPSLSYRGRLKAMSPALSSKHLVLSPGEMTENKFGKFI